MRNQAILALVLAANLQSAFAETTNRENEAQNFALFSKKVGSIGHTPSLDMSFMTGTWIGKNETGSVKVQETWTSSVDGEWFGVRKINDNGNVEFQLFDFSYKKQGIPCNMRRLSAELDEPVNSVSLLFTNLSNQNEKGTATFRFGDGTASHYRSIDNQRIALTLTVKDAEHLIDLKRQQ